MCEEFLFYYPQIPLTACLSTPEPESAYGAFLTRAFEWVKLFISNTVPILQIM